MEYNLLVVGDSKTSGKIIVKAACMAGLEAGDILEARNEAEPRISPPKRTDGPGLLQPLHARDGRG